MRPADDLACILCQTSSRENHDSIEDGKLDHTVVLTVLRCGCAVVCGLGLDEPPSMYSEYSTGGKDNGAVPGANPASYCFALL